MGSVAVSEVASWLQDGIAAAKAGERVKARALLERVVEADENNLQAWLWLSSVVTTLEDREVCLDNVLALDPNNAPARKGLEWVRAQIAATPEVEPESALPRVESIAASGIRVDFSDNEFVSSRLCVYCGHQTGEDDRQCPNCKRDLYRSILKREQPVWVWVAWTVSMVDVFYTVAALLVLVYILSAVLTVSSMAQDADVVQLMLFYVGRPSALSPQAQTVVLQVLPREIFFFRIGYVLVVALVAFGLISRKRIFHILFVASVAASVVAAYLDFNVNRTITVGISLAPSTLLQRILQVAVFEALGVYAQITGALAVLLTLLKGGLVFLLEDDFDVVTERLWSVIDRTVREPTTAFVRAKAYMKRGMWTLAAMYLRRSVSLQPDVVDYQLALAESYAHLGRYQRSLEILDQVERLQPNSPIAYHLRDVIVALQSRNAMRDTRKETGER